MIRRQNTALAAALILTLGVGVVRPAGHQRVQPGDLLEAYSRGEDIQARLGGAELSEPDFFRVFDREARAWIDSKDRHRTLIAAAVALEVAHMHRNRPSEWGGRYLHWATKLVRDRIHEDDDAERLWFIACVTTSLELDDPWTLTAGQQGKSFAITDLGHDLGDGGILALAVRRFPHESRFDLTTAIYLESRLLNLEPTAALENLAQRNLKIAPPADPQSSAEWTLEELHRSAAEILHLPATTATVAQAFLPLRRVSELAPDVELHLAWLDYRGSRFEAAKTRFTPLSSISTDPFVRFLAWHFLGRIAHYAGRDDQALSMFDRSLEAAPLARSSVAWLAALLAASSSATDHERADDLMRKAYSGEPAWDPWMIFGRSEVRHRADDAAQLQRALR